MSITTNIEVDKMCRTCLIPTEDKKSLYEACSSAMQMCVAELLSKCTSLKIPVANDGLPTHICQDCLCQLNQAYKFVLKCQKSDDKLRNHLNKNINTSAIVQISRRNDDITNTDGICIKTEEAVNINSPNIINTIQNANDLNANVKLEADFTLGISDLSMKQENVKTLDDGRCSGEDFTSPSLNDSFECLNDYKISVRIPLPTLAIHNLDQQLDVIKHDIDCDVKTEMQHYINYRNEDIDVNRASVNLLENATEPKPYRQSSMLLPEKETKNKIIPVHTKARNALSICVNSIEFKKSHTMNSVSTDEITSNQPENAMNMKNAVVILENNVHLKPLRGPMQHQFEQLNSAVSKSTNKIATIADTASTLHNIDQIHRDRQTSKINDQYCTKMPVKRKSKCRAINTTEETTKSATSRLRRHQVHIPYTCKFICTVCEKSFNNKRELRCHTMTHTRESLYQPVGNFTSVSRNEGGTHHVLKHMAKKSFVCNICEKTFARKSGLNLHLLTHTGEKTYSCAICDKTFTRKVHLTTHKLVHTGKKRYSCTTCDKTFNQRGSLITHKLIHTGEKPYSCTACDKTFNQRGGLATHKLIHTGAKPYSCAICDKTFNQRGNLANHKMTHTEEKPYSCATCDKTFSRRRNLTTHKLTHTRKKPYSCVTCDKTFTQRGSVTRHMLIHIENRLTRENV